jgi:DNA-binding transcriptional MerR regulator
MEFQFGERLRAIEVGIQGINDRLDRLNGSVGGHEDVIVKIQNRCAAHEQMTITETRQKDRLDQWRAEMDKEIQDLREARAGMKSTVSTALSILSFVGIVLMLAISFWQATQSHQERTSAPDTRQGR